MSSLKRLYAAVTGVALSLGLGACGFAPIAVPDSGGFGREALPLSSIQITTEEKRFEYELRRTLDPSVTIEGDAPLSLFVATTVVREGLAITAFDDVTRFNLSATSTYRLVDALGETVVSGSAISRTALNATTDQFATTIGEEDAVQRLAEDTARRLLNVLRLNRERLAIEPDGA